MFDVLFQLAKPWAKKIVEEKFFPYVQKLGYETYLKGRKRYQVNEAMVGFLAKTRAQCSAINTLAFPNILKKLDEIYQPLYLSSLDADFGAGNDILGTHEFILRNQKVLIIDNAGMGKSTLVKKLVVDTISKTDYIPVYLELRTLSDTPITSQVKKIFGLEENDSDDILKHFPFVYFLDGVDEIPSGYKASLLKKIKEFSDAFEGSKVIITSRPENSTQELYGFSRYKICPLKKEQSYDLLRLYNPDFKLANKLISEIEGMKDKDNILEFLTTPLYVSLLYCAYRFKPVIPRKKDLFYSQVYEALFETHDLSKETGYVREKKCLLDITDFSLILRRLGFWCLKNDSSLEFTRSKLEAVITEIVSNINGINVRPAYFMSDLINTVPLFVKEGSNYRWSHKSLMEYFAAQFICVDLKDKHGEVLYRLYSSKDAIRYKHVLELCADIDYTSFRKNIIKPCLKEYIHHTRIISDYGYLSDKDKEIWASITFYGNFSLKLNPYVNANLFDFTDEIYDSEGCDSEIYSNKLIGYQDYIVYLTFPESIKNVVFEILKWKEPAVFYRESFFYARISNLTNNHALERDLRVVNGMINSGEKCADGIIDVLLHFRHALSMSVIKKEAAELLLADIMSDETNGIGALLSGF